MEQPYNSRGVRISNICYCYKNLEWVLFIGLSNSALDIPLYFGLSFLAVARKPELLLVTPEYGRPCRHSRLGQQVMQVHNLNWSKSWSTLWADTSAEQRQTYLVSTLITDKDNKRPVVFLDIIVNENWYSRVELFAHGAGPWSLCETTRPTNQF